MFAIKATTCHFLGRNICLRSFSMRILNMKIALAIFSVRKYQSLVIVNCVDEVFTLIGSNIPDSM